MSAFRQFRFILISGVLLGGLRQASAQAFDVLSFTNVVASTTTDWSKAVDLPQFNTALGTLEAVTITLSSSLNTSLAITNYGNSASLGHVNTQLSVSLADSSMPNLFGTGDDQVSLTYASGKYNYILNRGASISTGMLTGSGTETGTITNQTILGNFSGTGYVDFNAATTTYTSLYNSGGNSEAAQSTSAGLITTITYDYSPTVAPSGIPAALPEPSEFALLGIGLAGLAGWRNRRRN